MTSRNIGSVVSFYSNREGHRCGYCGNHNSSISIGMWAYSLTVEDYERLTNRGWRRSGQYCYKPTMNQTCCPQYIIKCDVMDFSLSKSQKKVIKRVNHFLSTGQKPSTRNNSPDGDTEANSMDAEMLAVSESRVKSDRAVLDQGEPVVKAVSSTSVEAKAPSRTPATVIGLSEKVLPRPGSGLDPSKPRCRKAKDIRRERRQQKLLEKGCSIAEIANKQNQPKTLEDHLANIGPNPVHKLQIKLVRSCPPSDEFAATVGMTHKLLQRYQEAVHGETPDEWDWRQFSGFLVDSPLEEKDGSELPYSYGSYHQQYWLDDRLIAVGVIDILPTLLSSVYLYYDPEYSFLTLGTYGALREIAFTRHLHSISPQLKHYCMGYYIHSCPKMRYKGQYKPSYLLCPEAYTWQPIELCKPKLDISKYSRLDSTDKVDEDSEVDLDRVLCLYRRQAMPYSLYRTLHKHDISSSKTADDIRLYAQLVGRNCTQSIMLMI